MHHRTPPPTSSNPIAASYHEISSNYPDGPVEFPGHPQEVRTRIRHQVGTSGPSHTGRARSGGDLRSHTAVLRQPGSALIRDLFGLLLASALRGRHQLSQHF